MRPLVARALARAEPATLFTGALVLAVGLYALAGAGAYERQILAQAGIWVLLVLGYQFGFGHTGALNLAQGAFYGLGAYATGLASTRLGLPFVATFPLSIALPALVAALVARPIARLGSHYFALATLALSQLVLLLAVNWEAVTGGANGFAGVPAITIAGWRAGRGLPHLAIVWLVVALGAWAAWRAMRGLYGQAAHAVRDTPVAAAALGLDGARLRATALVAGAAYAGAAGALQAHTLRVVSPAVLAFDVMVLCLAMTVVGGRARVAGAFLGALLLTHLPEWVRVLDAYSLVANGLVLLLFVLYAPRGLTGALARLFARAPIAPPSGSPARLTRPRRRLETAASPPALAVAPALVLEGVVKSYGGVRALAGVDLTIAGGEVYGLIGPNGSGKTTLVNVVSGFGRPDAGAIRLHGKNMAGWAPHRIARAGVARSFQTPILPAGECVIDAIAVGRAMPERASLAGAILGVGSDPRARRARLAAAAILADLELSPIAARPCGALPLGARRRVEIARALALEPQLLLLDEPAAGLAPEEAAELGGILRDLARRGIAVLVVDHDLAFIRAVADRLGCLDQGVLIAEGPAESVLADARVRAAYLGQDGDDAQVTAS